MRLTQRHSALALVVGLLLSQAAWLLAVPAFRGIDEFDHAYRAASVARGEWLPSGRAAVHGRGELVAVPRDLVAAAGPECRARPYTGPANCAAVAPAGHGRAWVASAAALYHPAYYWVVGTAARWAHGTTALYVMRVTSALLCALFVWLTVWIARRWATTDWPVAAVVAATTPVLAYSSIVVAPNALEIVAALSLWTALTGLCRAPEPATERLLLWAAVPGAVVLATVRSLGVGFLGLTVLVVAAVLGGAGVRDLWRRQRRTLRAVVPVVLTAVAAAVAWVLVVRPNQGVEGHADNDGALLGTAIQVPVWVLQTIAAAPGRADPAPGLVYLLCGVVVAVLLYIAVRVSASRVRTALAVIVVLSLGGPFLLTLHTYRVSGVIWQGRYGLPLDVGLLVLAGLSLDLHPPTSGRRWWPLAGVGIFAAGHVLAVVHVLEGQRAVSPSVRLGLWSPPSVWLVVLLTVGGWALVAAALRPSAPADPVLEPGHPAPGLPQARVVT